jgi:hypothetical protein
MISGLLVRRVELSDKSLSISLVPECSSNNPEVSEMSMAMILRVDTSYFAHLESRAMRFAARLETCEPCRLAAAIEDCFDPANFEQGSRRRKPVDESIGSIDPRQVIF